MSEDEFGTDQRGGLPPYDGASWRAAPDVLAAQPEERDRRSAPWAVVAGVAAVVLALVGGVTYAVGALSGGGSQPADALPSGAFAVVSFDLDPSMGQKVDGFRFLRKFPALREKVPLDGDVREVLFDAVAEQAGWSDVDYEADVAPWLGKRLAIAAYPPPVDAEFPTPAAVVALQVTDQDKAQAGLQRLVSSFSSTDGGAPALGWAFSGDYALLAESTGVARDLARRAADESLAQDEPFASDLAEAGDGVAVAWVDMTAAGRSIGGSMMPLGGAGGLLGGVAGAGGRSTLVARFDGPDVFEVVGRASGAGSAADWAQHPVTGMAELPASSAAAIGLADGDELVAKAIASMRKSLGDQGTVLDEGIASFERELGIQVPEDLAVLLGDNLVAALDGERTDQVEAGARVSTDVTAAQRVLDKLEAAARSYGGDIPVVHRESGGDLVVASSDRQAELMSRSGTLGDVPAFSRALPDLADAEVAVWVDPTSVFETLFGGDGGADENLEPIDGLGLTMSGDKETATYRFRLVAH